MLLHLLPFFPCEMIRFWRTIGRSRVDTFLACAPPDSEPPGACFFFPHFFISLTGVFLPGRQVCLVRLSFLAPGYCSYQTRLQGFFPARPWPGATSCRPCELLKVIPLAVFLVLRSRLLLPTEAHSPAPFKAPFFSSKSLLPSSTIFFPRVPSFSSRSFRGPR